MLWIQKFRGFGGYSILGQCWDNGKENGNYDLGF